MPRKTDAGRYHSAKQADSSPGFIEFEVLYTLDEVTGRHRIGNWGMEYLRRHKRLHISRELPLPVPVLRGDITELRTFLNVDSDGSWLCFWQSSRERFSLRVPIRLPDCTASKGTPRAPRRRCCADLSIRTSGRCEANYVANAIS